ncbi:translation initiation factor IF-2-like [Lutra lutra]|uniref:translation initiation factor IF-2-like n=1 Tax=Lutra lutra TaxID=9657 RepID=UPI001FD00119|nr:translation initiation factor IF-2-like [Lutra lutra]
MPLPQRRPQGPALPWPRGNGDRVRLCAPTCWEGTRPPPPPPPRCCHPWTPAGSLTRKLCRSRFSPQPRGSGEAKPREAGELTQPLPSLPLGTGGVWGLKGGARAAPLSPALKVSARDTRRPGRPAAESRQTSEEASGFRVWGRGLQPGAAGCPESWSVPRRRDAHALGRESEGRPEGARALARARERSRGGDAPASGRVCTNARQHGRPRVPVSHRPRRRERLERPQLAVTAQTDRPPRRRPRRGRPAQGAASKQQPCAEASAALSPTGSSPRASGCRGRDPSGSRRPFRRELQQPGGGVGEPRPAGAHTLSLADPSLCPLRMPTSVVATAFREPRKVLGGQ